MNASTSATPTLVHPTAVIDAGAELGAGTRVWHFSHVMAGARLGARCVLGQNVFVGARVRIGDGVKIQNNVSVYDEVVLEDDVFCGPSMVFTNVTTPRAFIERKHEYRTTHVRRGATLGANCTVLCGTEIGAFALVGAGAVVTHDVPAHALVVGVPARQVGWVCRCGLRLLAAEPAPAGAAPTLSCSGCATHYTGGADGQPLTVQP
ncbi:MAG: N-acetyltransferase [Proteobacteria bacterium]|nr:N-acetyltransferase [Pseudomonadota bacterium]